MVLEQKVLFPNTASVTHLNKGMNQKWDQICLIMWRAPRTSETKDTRSMSSRNTCRTGNEPVFQVSVVAIAEMLNFCVSFSISVCPSAFLCILQLSTTEDRLYEQLLIFKLIIKKVLEHTVAFLQGCFLIKSKWKVPDGSQTLKGLEIHCEEARLCVCAERKDATGVWWKTSFTWAACLLSPFSLSHPHLYIPSLSLHPTITSASCPCCLPLNVSFHWGLHLEQLLVLITVIVIS